MNETDTAGDAVADLKRLTAAAEAEAAVAAALRAALSRAADLPDGVIDAGRITAAQYAAENAAQHAHRAAAIASDVRAAHKWNSTWGEREAAKRLQSRAETVAAEADRDVATLRELVAV